jgi:wyosine [tRNA(Phe)-imidazoG37] synthetase (radical SAM superfamily)
VRRLSPVLIVVALALVASGCGADTEAANHYVDAVNKAQTDFAATFDQLSGKITSTSTAAEDRETLEGFKKAIDKVVTDFRAVKAPDKVKELHGRLIAEISAYGKEIDKAKQAFTDEDPQAIVKAQADLVSAVTRVQSQINATIADINKKLRE